MSTKHIVLVESEIKHKILHKNIEKRELKATFLKNCARHMIVLLLTIYRGIEASRVANQITAFAILYQYDLPAADSFAQFI